MTTYTNTDEIWRIALQTFGNPEAAREWLNRSHPLLGASAPLQYALQGAVQAREVEQLIHAIRYGGPA